MLHKNILVTGTSGTGKTTVLRALSKRGVATIGIDEEPDLTWWVHKESGEAYVGDGVVFDQKFLDQYEWVCSKERLEKLLIQKDESVVVCGSSDNILECMQLFDMTLVLNCPPEVFLARIDARTDNDYGKSEAAKAALLGYYEAYRDECLEAGAIEVDATQAIDDVVEEVMSYLE